MISAIRRIVALREERTAETLPSSLNDFTDMLNKQDPTSDIATALAKKSLIPRTVDWIRSEGVCVDNLIPDVSTLHDAGQGAFAQRLIPQGSIVVPAPVIQIIDAAELNMYDFDTDELIGTQLLINYCFAHPGTTLLLCPQTNAILINHCSSRRLALAYGGDCDRYNSHDDVSFRGPNAYVRWASEWDPDTDTSLSMSWEDFYEKTKEGKRLLSMDIIASRDIFPGDEVCLCPAISYRIHIFSLYHTTPTIPFIDNRYLLIMMKNGNKHGMIIFNDGIHPQRPTTCLSKK